MKKTIPFLIILAALAFPVLARPEVYSQATAFYDRGKIPAPTGEEPIVALSIDDGPDPRYTPLVLKTLRDYEARATFFVVGSRAAENTGLTMEIALQGHELANHTWSHPDMESIPARELMAEVNATNVLISKLTGCTNTYFRPPRGVLKPEARTELERAGYKIIMWDIGIENSKMKTPREMADRVLKNIKPGSIILLHDGLLDRSKTVEALPLLLDGLREKGYRATTVSEVIQQAAP